MSDVQFIEFRIREAINSTGSAGLDVFGSEGAFSVSMVLVRKHLKGKDARNAGGLLMAVYETAKEMKLNLVSAYHFRDQENGEIFACRCFQGKSDVIDSFFEDKDFQQSMTAILNEVKRTR